MSERAEVEKVKDVDLDKLKRADVLECVEELGLLAAKVRPQRELKLILNRWHRELFKFHVGYLHHEGLFLLLTLVALLAFRGCDLDDGVLFVVV
jgi:hypothetical protein